MRKFIIALIALMFCVPSTAQACTPDGWCGKKHSTYYNRRVIRHVAAYRHENADLLVWLAYKESSWQNWQVTGSGSLACKGLFQHQTRVEKRRWANPYWSTKRAIVYAHERYGSVEGAIRFWRAHHWY